ncbi:TetR/AcrR family transcriptional regulator [Streptomyces sp. SKN60]|uniref:TetR/AcrR family transcriptional regulator n=1 Tax=Streptomyces sp. SKN60 TaxID=2855506 RepID=UPI00224651CA|nr:TetR/AcrR family transcriptional regulator [Streptomyces sp. SKN60]
MSTALRLVDEHGPEALSVSRIAAEIGVKGPSMYNHISGRDELVEGLRELLVAQIDTGHAELRPWTVAAERWARAYRTVFAAHPRVVPLLTAQPVGSAATLESYERAYAVLREAHWPEAEIPAVVRSIEYFVIGSALDLMTRDPEQAELAFEIGLASLIKGLKERLTEHAEGHRRTSGPNPHDQGPAPS